MTLENNSQKHEDNVSDLKAKRISASFHSSSIVPIDVIFQLSSTSKLIAHSERRSFQLETCGQLSLSSISRTSTSIYKGPQFSTTSISNNSVWFYQYRYVYFNRQVFRRRSSISWCRVQNHVCVMSYDVSISNGNLLSFISKEHQLFPVTNILNSSCMLLDDGDTGLPYSKITARKPVFKDSYYCEVS